MPTTTFTEWLRARRAALGLSRPELAAAVGVNEARVAKWEAGEKAVTVAEAARVFRALGTPDADVLALLAGLRD